MKAIGPVESAVAEAPPAVEATPIRATKAVAKLEMLDGDEIIQLSIKPSFWFIPLVSLNWLLATIVPIVAIGFLMSHGWTREGQVGVQVLVAAAALRVGVATLQWASRLYVLTNRRVMRFKGVLMVDVQERRLAKISAVELRAPWYSRVLRLGSIRMSAVNSEVTPLDWDDVGRPHEIHEILERAVRKAQL